MSVNYITKYPGNKVAIEVSDPSDIDDLSTLYANGSETRVVNMNAELYRLINGQWKKVHPKDSVQPDPEVFVIKLIAGSYSNKMYSDITLDKSLEEIMRAATQSQPIIVQFQYTNPQGTMAKSMFAEYTYTESRVDLSSHFYAVEDPSEPSVAYDYLWCTITCVAGQDNPQVSAGRDWR